MKLHNLDKVTLVQLIDFLCGLEWQMSIYFSNYYVLFLDTMINVGICAYNLQLKENRFKSPHFIMWHCVCGKLSQMVFTATQLFLICNGRLLFISESKILDYLLTQMM